MKNFRKKEKNQSVENLQTEKKKSTPKMDEISMTIKSSKPDEKKSKLLTLKQAAKLLSQSNFAVYSKVRRGELPHMKKGKHYYFSQADLVPFIKPGKVKKAVKLENSTIIFLNKTCENYQKSLEKHFGRLPSGTCYLSAHILSIYLNKNSIEARSVTGNLALIERSGKYITYGGNLNLSKSEMVGIYHTWCEAIIDNETYIIDPSLKYNTIFLKKNLNIKVSRKIPSYLITKDKVTFNWKYLEDPTFRGLSDSFVDSVPTELINIIMSSL